MSDTTRLQLPLIAAAQAQKHVTHNEAILRLDGLVQMTAKSYTTGAQPGSPADGDLYLCPAGKTGADWGGYSNHAVAHYYDGVWHQYHPNAGWLCWVQDTAILYYYTGTEWSAVPLPNALADGSAGAPGLAFAADSNTGLYRAGADNPALAAGGSKLVDWSPAGNLQPLQPAFQASPSGGSNVTGDGTAVALVCQNERFDRGGNHSTSTGRFTAPRTGLYKFSCVLALGGITSTGYFGLIQLVTTAKTYDTVYSKIYADGSYAKINADFPLADMSAGDTAYVSFFISGGTKTVSVNSDTYFSGYLLC